MTVIVNVDKVYKFFGRKQVLRDLSFELHSGRIVGLLGPNGAGKTTLIKTLMGLYPPSRGHIQICGRPVDYATKAHIAYMPDVNHLLPWMLIRDAIRFYQDMFPDFDPQRSVTFSEILELDLNERVSQCSRGTQQRLLIMLTLSRNAKLYLLDEPIGGIDPLGVNKILKTIFSTLIEDSTLLISTHLVKEIETLVDEVYFIHDGRFLFHDAAETIRLEKKQSIEECYLEVLKNV